MRQKNSKRVSFLEKYSKLFDKLPHFLTSSVQTLPLILLSLLGKTTAPWTQFTDAFCISAFRCHEWLRNRCPWPKKIFVRLELKEWDVESGIENKDSFRCGFPIEHPCKTRRVATGIPETLGSHSGATVEIHENDTDFILSLHPSLFFGKGYKGEMTDISSKTQVCHG